MRKYTINVFGKGAECYVHKLTPEQKIKLDEINTGTGDEDSQEIASILGINDVYETDFIHLGPYNNPELYLIQVKNENDEIIWESDNKHSFEEEEYEGIYFNEDVLIVEDYSKGEFYSYDLEIDEEFDPKKITPLVTDLCESSEIITELNYNERPLSPFKEYGDYWSKGITYYLNSNDTERA
jgi:hypothetical protein